MKKKNICYSEQKKLQRHHLRRKYRRRRLSVLVCICLFSYVAYSGVQKVIEKQQEDEQEKNDDLWKQTKSKKKKQMILDFSDTKINSKHAILVDLQDYTKLYEKKGDKKIYPASLTKIMTALVALDNIPDIQEIVMITQENLNGLMEANASVAGLLLGQKISYKSLLYALILPSGADAANVLSDNLAASRADYIRKMNNKAQELGMSHTHYVNTTGLHDASQYTTLEDMLILMKAALKNPILKDILTTLSYTAEENTLEQPLTVHSTIEQYADTLQFPGGQIIGGKSGYTPEAGSCLISIAKLDDGSNYMILSAQAGGDPTIDHLHIKDAKTLFEKVVALKK